MHLFWILDTLDFLDTGYYFLSIKEHSFKWKVETHLHTVHLFFGYWILVFKC